MLAGVVIDATTNRPLPNAEVVWFRRPLQSANRRRRGLQGRRALKAGPATIKVKAGGLKSETVTKTLKSGEETKVEIKLLGDAKLAGTLNDGLTGLPIADADVQIEETVLKGKTGKDGRFEISGPRSGPAKIEVAAKGYLQSNLFPRTGSGPHHLGRMGTDGNRRADGNRHRSRQERRPGRRSRRHDRRNQNLRQIRRQRTIPPGKTAGIARQARHHRRRLQTANGFSKTFPPPNPTRSKFSWAATRCSWAMSMTRSPANRFPMQSSDWKATASPPPPMTRASFAWKMPSPGNTR